MSAGKHTPGPWEVTAANWDGCEAGETNYTIRMPEQVASKANARLIEAAPELLEALNRLVIAADSIGGEHVEGAAELDAAAGEARAAIAKATGEQA